MLCASAQTFLSLSSSPHNDISQLVFVLVNTGLFLVVGSMNAAVTNIHIQVLMWAYIFISLGKISRLGVTGSNVNRMLVL